MSRKSTPIKSLYGYTIEDLKKMRNSHKSEFARTVLTAIVMRAEGTSTTEISKFILKSIPTVVSYITKWNSVGLKALEDNRGSYSEGTFTAEMLDDLLNTVLNTHPNDFGFLGNVWTTPLLAEYINQNYGIKYSSEYIRLKLKENNFSFKRAQRKSTKANKDSQEAFKKNERPSTYCRKFF